MAKPRQIKSTGKDPDGDITSVKGAFGEVPLNQAIRQIERGDARYAVDGSDVHVVNGPNGKYIRTSPDGEARNNLDNLPDA
ncbi:MAG: DUF3892 domain-containing protein [Microthrixaceae bacterium]